MKYIVLIFLSFLAVMVAVFAGQYVASERIEVVELHTNDDSGKTLITRLWVVDHEGNAFLRTGDDQSGWYSRLIAAKTVTMNRGDKLGEYQITIRPELKDRINQLMHEKYTWGDSFIGTLFGREHAIPIQLIPVK